MSTASSQNINLPLSYAVQRVVTYAYNLPFTTTSYFTLSIGSFYGKYFVYAGDAVYNVFVSASRSTRVYSSTGSSSSQILSNVVTPGEFIRVGGQEFRVCMNEDPQFQIDFGVLNATEIPLCSVANAFVPMLFDAGYPGHVLPDIPVYTLDTIVGGAPSPELGSVTLTIQNADKSLNTNVGLLNAGDYLMIGHPIDGEVFRVFSNANSLVTLASVDDVTAYASLSIKALQHATYEVQLLTFTSVPFLTTQKEQVGFRLRFRGATTFVTQSGGEKGCLSLMSTANEVRAELLNLFSVDDILVSQPSNSSTDSSYRVTFTGSLLRGAIGSLLEVVDLGTNGCNSRSGVSYTGTTVVRQSVVPVYRTETTANLPYDASAADVKDALEGLNRVAR